MIGDFQTGILHLLEMRRTLLAKVLSLFCYLFIKFPKLISFHMMAFYHLNSCSRLCHIQTKIINSNFFVHCIRENLKKVKAQPDSRKKQTHLVSSLPMACINSNIFIFFSPHCIETLVGNNISNFSQYLVPKKSSLALEQSSVTSETDQLSH